MVTDLDVCTTANTRAISYCEGSVHGLSPKPLSTLLYSPKVVVGSTKIVLPLLELFVHYDASNHRS